MDKKNKHVVFSQQCKNVLRKSLTAIQYAGRLMYHYDLYIHQYVNTALPHSVFPRLACPTLACSENGCRSSNSSAHKDH